MAEASASKVQFNDPDLLREVLGRFATGVAVVTTCGEEAKPVGLTVSSFNSVSLAPPLILWSLSLDSPNLPAFRNHDFFAVNILAETQLALCKKFAKSGADKFAGVEHRPGISGVPLLIGAAAHFECRTYARYPGGDHEIYLGEVIASQGFDHEPLLFHRGAFRRFLPHDAA